MLSLIHIFWLGRRLNPDLFVRWESAEDLINDYLLTDLAVVGPDGKVQKANFSAATDDNWGHTSVTEDGGPSVTTKCPYTFDQLVEAGGHAYDEWNATCLLYTSRCV